MLILQPQSPMFLFQQNIKRGLDLLEDEISHLLLKDYEVFELSIPYSQGKILNIYINIVM